MAEPADPPAPSAQLARRLRLVLVTPGRMDPAATEQLVQACLDGGVTAVWCRELQLDLPTQRTLYARLVQRCADAGALSLIGRDPALAAQLGADAVHLGAGSPSVTQARALHPTGFVTRSAHWPLQPEDSQVDACSLSPFAATPKPRPVELLSNTQIAQALATLTPRPVFALGGLDAAQLPELPDGLCGVAVLRALADAPDPRTRAAQLRSLIDARLDFGGEAWA